MTDAPALIWYHRDLRLDDHPALSAAAATGRPLAGVFVLDDAVPLGGAARWWLHGSLSALAETLARHRVPLILRNGSAARELAAAAAETGANAIFWNRRSEPAIEARDTALKNALERKGIACHIVADAELAEPGHIRSQAGTPFKVFTPFHRALLATTIAQPLPPPRTPNPFTGPFASDRLEDWGLLPTAPDWAGGLRAAWSPGEKGARQRLLAFIDDAMADYAKARDVPAQSGTARLSPHLAFGEISARRAWHTAIAHAPGVGRDAFLRQLAWRAFCRNLLVHAPSICDRPLQPAFNRFPWVEGAVGLRAWQRGRTGYPIVDAGMRELWATGWMHNRVRMIVASFLTKHMRVDWRKGAAWFWDTLVDADLANNVANWQWVAGCGADAAPYYRIFNPVLQGEKFDAAGDYVRSWVPELADVPASVLHAPWRAQRPPTNYPAPIVDHATARAAAFAAYRSLRAEQASAAKLPSRSHGQTRRAPP